jgi:hypothetical protein
MDSLDIIGDVHGHADALEALLAGLGYARSGGAWRHPERLAVFVGDLVDRGPRQLDTVDIARRMRDAGTGVVAMGNHEFNAIAWARRARPHDARNRTQHAAFLDAVGEDSPLHRELVGWFETLPLWLDLPTVRVVHACWDPASMDLLAPLTDASGALTESGLARTLDPADPAFSANEIVLKGPEAALPPGVSFRDSYGHVRMKTRVSWWDPEAVTFRRAAILDDETRLLLPDTPLPAGTCRESPCGRPVLFGHYWMRGEPVLLGPGAACLDFSVANGGVLAAYRHDGESVLDASRFAFVPSTATLDDGEDRPAPSF